MRQTAAEERAELLAKLRDRGGEAIKQGQYFQAGGRAICDESMMRRMARNGLVRIETVGASTFAVAI